MTEEMKAAIANAVKGMAVNDVAEAIVNSPNGAAVADPMALAALFLSWAA